MKSELQKFKLNSRRQQEAIPKVKTKRKKKKKKKKKKTKKKKKK